MNFKPIIIVPGEPNSIFFEILFKTLNYKKFKSPIIFIGSKNLLIKNMKFFKFNYKIEPIEKKNISKLKYIHLSKNVIHLININYSDLNNKTITIKSRKYITECFDMALQLLKDGVSKKFINGAISKKHFLSKKFNGITEYLANKTNTKKYCMLIFNKKLSVCPITTHLPIKLVNKKLNKKLIIEKIELINKFYLNKFKVKPRIAITGLNPHCESRHFFDEDSKILKPAIKHLQDSKIIASGPHPADTIFLKNNRKNFNVIVGMYHDQVLTPLKTLFEYDAINITLGLPFLRVSPDHGPNEKMIGKSLSNPLSLIRAIEFLDN